MYCNKIRKFYRKYDVYYGKNIPDISKLRDYFYKQCSVKCTIIKKQNNMPYDEKYDSDKMLVNGKLLSHIHNFFGGNIRKLNAIVFDSVLCRTTKYLKSAGLKKKNIVICERDDRIRRIHETYVSNVFFGSFHCFVQSTKQCNFSVAFLDCNNALSDQYMDDIMHFIQTCTSPTGCIIGVTFIKRNNKMTYEESYEEFQKRLLTLSKRVELIETFEYETRSRVVTVFLKVIG